MNGRVLAPLFLLVALASVAPALGGPPLTITEDFSTTLLRDPVATTANWDVATGRLRLHPFTPTDAGFADTPGSAQNVAVRGRYAFVADYDQGLRVFDVANPDAVVQVGALALPGYQTEMAFHGDRLYLAGGSGGIYVVDISDPTSPASVTTVFTNGYANDVSVEGDLLCLADGTAGLRVLDASDPDAPALLGSVDTPGYAHSVDLRGRYAYVADGTNGLRVIDVGNPAAPVEVGAWDSPGTAYDVVVAGRLALIADYGRGLQVVDVTIPSTPLLIGTRDTPGQARGLSVQGNLVCVADGPNGLQVVSIADPRNPVILAARDTPDYAHDVDGLREHAWVADGADGLRGVRVRHAHRPFLTDIDPGLNPTATALVVDGGLLFAPGFGGLAIFDIHDPLHRVKLGELTGLDFQGVPDVAVRGGLAAMTLGDAGLALIDVSNPGSPVLLGQVDTPGQADDVVLIGSYAIVADQASDLQIVNIANPAAPAIVNAVAAPGNAAELAVDGDVLYVMSWLSGVRTYDVSDPSSPAFLAQVPGTSGGLDLDAAGGYVYVAGGYSQALWVIDARDPAAPTVAQTLAMTRPFRVSVGDGFAVVVQGGEGPALRVLDLADPADPADLGAVAIENQPWGALPCGDWILAADQNYSPYLPFELAQRRLDITRANGQTIPLALPEEWRFDVVRLQVSATGDPSWYQSFSLDGGATFLDHLPWEWYELPSHDLQSIVLRAQLDYETYGLDPSVDELAVKLRYTFPVITGVTDVPGDQGGRVRVAWVPTGYETPDAEDRFEYSVYRRVPAGKAASGRNDPAVGSRDKSWPPGAWDYLVTVPGDREDSYSVVVPTLADASPGDPALTTFFVRARTLDGGALADSPPDSGASVDNLAPDATSSFTVTYGVTGNFLAWAPVDAEDLAVYRVYRGPTPGFTPGPANLVGSAALPSWIDRPADPWAWRYKVAAVDRAGNEGPAVAPGALSDVLPGDGAGPHRLALHEPVPNPFNPATTLRYDVPSGGGFLELAVYDARGRRVRTLFAGRGEPGTHAAVWDGQDDAGRRLPSGVYFARLQSAGRTVEVRKLVLAG